MGKSTINGPFSIAMLVYYSDAFPMLFPLDAELSHWRRTIRWSFRRPSRFPQPSKACFSLEKRGNKKGEFMVKKVNLWWKRWIDVGQMWNCVGKMRFFREEYWLAQANYVYPGNIVVHPRKNVIARWTLNTKDPTNKGICMWCKCDSWWVVWWFLEQNAVSMPNFLLYLENLRTAYIYLHRNKTHLTRFTQIITNLRAGIWVGASIYHSW